MTEEDVDDDVEMEAGDDDDESDDDTVDDEENGPANKGEQVSMVDSPPNKIDDAVTHDRDATSRVDSRAEKEGDEQANSDDNETTDSEELAAGGEEATSSTTDNDNVVAAAKKPEPTPASATAALPVAGPIRPKPKIRIKLTLPRAAQARRKLPLSAPSASASSNTKTSGEESSSSRPPAVKSFKKSLPLSKHVTGTGSRRRPVAPSKQIKIPPLASPGLLVPGRPTPGEIFDMAMEGAGYTVQQRTEHPHRGSSVRRTVDDMFDTDVKLALHPIELVPRDILRGVTERNGESVPLISLLSKHFGKANGPPSTGNTTVPSFLDMAPISLTIPYPKDYLDKRLAYVQKVSERENLIVEYQEAHEDIEMDTEEGAEKKPNPVQVPAIPDLPEPISVDDLGLSTTDFTPRADLVAHLDPKCFHMTGRYFGLKSNHVADPNVCGPSTAGFSGTSGLATATTSTTTSTSGLSGGGMTVILSAGFHCAAAVPLKETASAKPQALLAPPAAPSETANALRLLMMDEAWAEKFQDVIIKAAAYASRTQVYDTSFKGPNNLVYPDLGRAFSMYTQVKPCSRCKSNKQGVYHCRIRRRHKEADFDGGATASVLDPFEVAPLESLLVT